MGQENGKRTKDMHYLSQCIIKYFKPKANAPFWAYNIKDDAIDDVCNKKLFSNEFIWSQKFENKLANKYEQPIGVPLKKLINYDLVNGTNSNIFVYKEVTELVNIRNLSKLCFQNVIVRYANSNRTEEPPDWILKMEPKLYSTYLLEVTKDYSSTPIILADSHGYIHALNEGKKLADLIFCVCFPISESRILVMNADNVLVTTFCEKFKSIDDFNLARIQDNKEINLIATQDKNYLESLKNKIKQDKKSHLH